MAFVLAPEAPVAEWLSALDDQMGRSPEVFDARPVVIDMSKLTGTGADIPSLIGQLEGRDLRIIGVESTDPTWSDRGVWGLPPLNATSRSDRAMEIAEKPDPAATAPEPEEVPSMLITRPVRSGQSVIFERGDLTIVGSVASGAEVIAGGSIHVYGSLRGRAIAGFAGHSGARIFCGRLEAELLAINGVYKIADDIGPEFRGRRAQALLDGDSIVIAPLD